MTIPTTVKAEYLRATTAEKALSDRITALEKPAATIVPFPLTDTKAQFVSMAADMTIDVIELAAGTYHFAEIGINVDRTARPLTIRPAVPGSVIFAGDKGTGGGQFYLGLGGVAKYITMQDFILDGWHIGDTGNVWVGNADHITLNGFTVRNVTVTGQGSIYSWALYCSHDAGVNPTNIVADGWKVQGVNQNFSALQYIAAANASHAYFRNWTVDQVGYVVFAAATPLALTDFQLDGWTITNSFRPDVPTWAVRFDPGVTGTIKNMHATHSGGIQAIGGMTDGGGNVWA